MKKKYKVTKTPTEAKTVSRNGGNINNFRAPDYQYYSNDPWNYSKANNSGSGNLNTATNNTIKTTYEEVDEDLANVEAEKGETILKNGGEGFFKISGKSHARGGTHIQAGEGDFIFSKKLKLKGEILNGEFGNFNPKKDFSISDVSKKYMKLNKFKDLQSSKDTLDQSTGSLMHTKYLDKLAKLALLQEADKGFPGGIPDISKHLLGINPKSEIDQDTLQQPVFPSPEEQMPQEQLQAEEQFAQTGGVFNSTAKSRNNNFGTNKDVPVPVPISDEWKKVHNSVNKFLKDNGIGVYNEDNLEDGIKKGDQFNPIESQLGYQQSVATYATDQLLALFKNNKMPLTNKGKEALGITKKGDIYFKDIPEDKRNDLEEGVITNNGEVSMDEFLLDQYQDGLPGHRRIDFKQGDLTREQVLARDFGNKDYDFLGETDFYIGTEEDLNDGDGSFTFYIPITEEQAGDKNEPLEVITEKDLERKNIEVQKGDVQSSEFRDLGFSTPEHITLANNLLTISSIPKHEPTRFQNYGLQQALGIVSNLQPFNYQSAINESNRSGLQGIRANNQISPNSSIAAARNASISGRLAENTSRIKGDEYNQNANLYNSNQLQIANYAAQIGADKEQQGSIYVDKVNQTNENYWANRLAARNNFAANLGESYERRGLRNSLDFYAQSRIPNYKIRNADGAASFQSGNDPLGFINSLSSPQQSQNRFVNPNQYRNMSPEQREREDKFLDYELQISRLNRLQTNR